MDIICSSCQKGFSVPDEKLPTGRAVSMICPSCRGRIQIDIRKDSPSEQQTIDDELESMEEASKRALVCLCEKDHQEAIRSTLEAAGYRVRIGSSIEEALDRIRFVLYDILVLHEEFAGSRPESNPIIQRMRSMQMESRRDTFFALVGKNFRTLNNRMAFSNSANLVINEADLSKTDQFLRQAITENERFYRVFKEIKNVMDR